MSRSTHRWFRVEQETGGRPSVAALDRLVERPLASVNRDPELSPRDWGVFLLHTAAEIEHSLLVQYLYAGYSIRQDSEPFKSWRSTVLRIAREEMGHLLTIQNVLWLIGAPPNFERQDFPYRSSLYPFEFHLAPFTKEVLAKYVIAEMPENVDESVLPLPERNGILFRAAAEARTTVNHVGVLYQELLRLFSDHSAIPDSVFRSDRSAYQELPGPWRADGTHGSLEGIKVFPVADRETTLQALATIGRQGESPDPNDLSSSHFERFLEIYRRYGDDVRATLPVASNPTTDNRATAPLTAISDPTTLAWAHLANVRYRELLVLLAHVVRRRSDESKGGQNLSELLMDRVWEVMSSRRGVGRLAVKLTTLDMSGVSGLKAGAPFELPYALALPQLDNDCWRVHLDLLDAEEALATQIGDSELDEMIKRNGEWRKIISDLHLAE